MPICWQYRPIYTISSLCSQLKRGYDKIELETGVDVRFLKNLISYIESEFQDVDENDPEQRFIVFQKAFNKVLESVQNYKLLLIPVKKEYESIIELLRNAKQQHPTLKTQKVTLSTQCSTINNYKGRIYQLEELIAIQRGYNKNLARKYDELHNKSPETVEHSKDNATLQKGLDKRVIPGITIEQSTDLTFLNNTLKHLTQSVEEMDMKLKLKYFPKSHKDNLKNLLKANISERDLLNAEGHYLKTKRQRIKVAYEAAQAYNDIRPPHWSVGDIVTHALRLSVDSHIEEKEKTTVMGDDSTVRVMQDPEPDSEKEAGIMLENIEIFNDMLENLLYSEAAMHAAISPKGILRTMDTLLRFKNLKNIYADQPSPCFIFCKALLSTVEDERQKPDKELSLECVLCALKEREFQLLFYWLSQKKLTITKDVADLIQNYCKCPFVCTCRCLSLAEYIYTQLGLHKEAAFTLLRQNRIAYGLHYAQTLTEFETSDYEAAFRACPTLQLASSLLLNVDSQRKTIKPLLSLNRVFTFLIEMDNIHILKKLWKKVTNTVLKDAYKAVIYDLMLLEEYPLEDSWHDLVEKINESGEELIAIELQAFIFSYNALNVALKTKTSNLK